MLFTGRLEAQTGTVTGTVSGEAGQPLGNAQIQVVGTRLGARTADNGKYTLVNVPTGTVRLRAILIGYRPEDMTLTVRDGQTATQDFTLKTQALSLDAVVVTGTAGAARQRELGNSISQINLSEVSLPPSNVGQLLQGKAAGMQVMPSSAGAGSGSMIRLRGNVSVAMSNQPLLYVDGVRIRSDGYQRNVPPTGSDLRSGNDVASPLNDINPNDIERVEVIKGAAAATLYGTEAAAGVIQIFTKSGRSGKPVWTFNVDQGFAQALPFGPDMSKAPPSDTIYGCVTVSPCSGTMAAYRDSFPNRFKGLPTRGVSRAGGTSRYLFIDPWLRRGLQQRYSLSVGGGAEALRYFVSGTTTNENGVLPNDNEQKNAIRGNFSFSPLPDLLFTWNTSYTKDNIANTAAGNNAHGLTLNSFRRDRNYASNDRPEIVSKMLNQRIESRIDHLITGGSVNWTPRADFTNKLTLGYDLAQINNRNLRPFGFILAPAGIISDRQNSYQSITVDYAGNYVRPFGSSLRTTLSWGGQGITTENRETSAYGENFPGPGDPTVSSAGTTLGFEARSRVINAGGFGQLLVDYKNRYFVTAGLRVDGNSAFGKDFGLQNYPKVSLSWVASEEDYWPEWMSELKLRAAWGQSGRAPGAFDAVRTWDPVGWGGQPAFFTRNVGNSKLGPERTSELEAGFDAAFWGDRLTATFTWFSRKIEDALFNARQIPSLGFLNSQLKNVGSMKSSGIELTADVPVLRTRNYEWTIGGSVYTSSSEVLSLGGAADFSLGNFGWIMEGQAIPVIRTDQCVTNASARGADPIISTDPDDCIHGPNLPTRTFGIRTSLTLPYRITLTANGEYQAGHYIYDGAAYNAVVRSVRWPGCYDFYTMQETNRLAEVPALQKARCTVSLTRADYFVYPADFFKLRDVSLMVPIPRSWLHGLSSANLTLAARNAVKWVNKDFPVFDPETGNNGGFDASVRSILEHVPPPANFVAALRVVF
ncbi:MAG: Vitamin B12 transporter BtuB [Gemmatimonadaceae bacterium]|nr:Vitamin B12 transporter BtuB [Gemmatimonadaceae bacterium]